MEELTAETTRKKFRPRSLRHQSWNYAGHGWYHVTICAKNPIPFFGEIDGEGNMRLNASGRIVRECWLTIPMLRPSVELDEFSIMPDHLHGILGINRDAADSEYLPLKDHWRKGCLGSVINQFKGACTKRICELCPSFAWRRNFNDHIIRNEKDLERIRRYIRSNPAAHAFGKEGWREYAD